jgi:hypothetical protein
MRCAATFGLTSEYVSRKRNLCSVYDDSGVGDRSERGVLGDIVARLSELEILSSFGHSELRQLADHLTELSDLATAFLVHGVEIHPSREIFQRA